MSLVSLHHTAILIMLLTTITESNINVYSILTSEKQDQYSTVNKLNSSPPPQKKLDNNTAVQGVCDMLHQLKS